MQYGRSKGTTTQKILVIILAALLIFAAYSYGFRWIMPASLIGGSLNYGAPVHSCRMYNDAQCETFDHYEGGKSYLFGSEGDDETPKLEKGDKNSCEVIGQEDIPAFGQLENNHSRQPARV
jgi:hypothetical protein